MRSVSPPVRITTSSPSSVTASAPADIDPDGAGTGARAENEIELDGVLAAVEDEIGGRIDVSVRDTPEGRDVTPPLLRIV